MGHKDWHAPGGLAMGKLKKSWPDRVSSLLLSLRLGKGYINQSNYLLIPKKLAKNISFVSLLGSSSSSRVEL
jgi:hypothetical protein